MWGQIRKEEKKWQISYCVVQNGSSVEVEDIIKTISTSIRNYIKS